MDADILPFGMEQWDVVTAERFAELQHEYKDSNRFAYAILREIYFMKTHRQNCNVRYVTVDGNQKMVVWDGESWVNYPDEVILNDMFTNYYKVVTKYIPTDEETIKKLNEQERCIKF
jgi:hypothetical protein